MLQEGIVPSFIILLLLIIILKVAHDLGFLVHGEHLYFLCLGLGQLHPWVSQYLLRCESLEGVGLQDFLQNGQCSLRNIARRSPTALHIYDLLLKLPHIRGLERNSAEEHSVEDDTSTPNIGLEAAIPLALEHFRRDVGGRTTLLMLNLILALD